MLSLSLIQFLLMTTATFITIITVFYNRYNYFKVIKLPSWILPLYYLLTHTAINNHYNYWLSSLLLLLSYWAIPMKIKPFVCYVLSLLYIFFLLQTASYSFFFAYKVCHSWTILTNFSIPSLYFFQQRNLPTYLQKHPSISVLRKRFSENM